MKTDLLLIVLAVLISVLLVRTRKRQIHFSAGDSVDVFDFYGKRVRGKVYWANETIAWVEFIDSIGTSNYQNFYQKDLMFPGPHVKPKKS